MMTRKLAAAFLALAAIAPSPTASAQEGAAQRVGQALDRVGKGIRREVETGVARGQVTAFERDLLSHVQNRVRWDKALAGAALEFQVQPDGTVVLRGAVLDDAAKRRAVDLAQSTIGVTAVVDELVVGKAVQVVPVVRPNTVIVAPARPVAPVIVVPAAPPVVVPVTPPVPARDIPPPVNDPEVK